MEPEKRAGGAGDGGSGEALGPSERVLEAAEAAVEEEERGEGGGEEAVHAVGRLPSPPRRHPRFPSSQGNVFPPFFFSSFLQTSDSGNEMKCISFSSPPLHHSPQMFFFFFYTSASGNHPFFSTLQNLMFNIICIFIGYKNV